MTSSLWSPDEILAAVRGTVIGTPPTAAHGVSIDSRTLTPHDIFVALVGPSNDGHDYVRAVLDQGAAAVIVSRIPKDTTDRDRLILVNDTQTALEQLGHAARARSKARVIAITGSVGKTTTKEMLALVLAQQKPTHWSVGSYNNLWGVPLSLARMPREAAYAVFEIGMNHPREIVPLTKQIRPDIAIVTTVEPVHLEFFRNVAAIADAKAEIFDGVPPNGTAILNRDNQWCERLGGAAARRGIHHIVTFGEADIAQIQLQTADLDSDGTTVTARIGKRTLQYRLNQPGRHIVSNSLAVLAAVYVLGADLDRAAAQLARFEGVSGRGMRYRISLNTGAATLIDESYNASPTSVRAALSVLGRMNPAEGGRRIAVLGDMRELGVDGPALHRDLADAATQAGVDLVFTCGPLMQHLHDALPRPLRGGWTENAAALHPIVTSALRSGDVIMVKGSLGSHMADIVKPLIAGPSTELSDADQDS